MKKSLLLFGLPRTARMLSHLLRMREAMGLGPLDWKQKCPIPRCVKVVMRNIYVPQAKKAEESLKAKLVREFLSK